MNAALKTHMPQQNGRNPETGPAVLSSVKTRLRAPDPTITPADVDTAIGEGGTAWERLVRLVHPAVGTRE